MDIYINNIETGKKSIIIIMRAVHVGLFQDFLNDVMHCKIEDDLSFRDVICFEV